MGSDSAARRRREMAPGSKVVLTNILAGEGQKATNKKEKNMSIDRYEFGHDQSSTTE